MARFKFISARTLLVHKIIVTLCAGGVPLVVVLAVLVGPD